MTIRILNPSGVGEWAYGAVLDVDERRALRLIRTGYAEAVKVKAKRPDKEFADASEPRPRL